MASEVNGKILHYGDNFKNRHDLPYSGKIPDIVKDDEIHEVEVIHLVKKVTGYSKIPNRKKLWLIFDVNPFLTFSEIETLYYDGIGFTESPLAKDALKNALSNEELLELQKNYKEKQDNLRMQKVELDAQILKRLNKEKEVNNQIEHLKDELNKIRKEKRILTALIEKSEKSEIYGSYHRGNSLVSIKLNPYQVKQLFGFELKQEEVKKYE